MTEVHYFQRYSQKENVVTNNTLLLLSRLYSNRPLHLERLLSDLIDADDFSVGPNFVQQRGHGGGSVPDGQIYQPSFRLVIETKRGKSASTSQLREHLGAFEGEGMKVLLLLMPTEPGSDLEAGLRQIERDYNEGMGPDEANLLVVSSTFKDLIDKYDEVLSDYDFEMKELLADYREFCMDSGLMPKARFRMRAVPCGKTLQQNLDFGIYYEGAHRSSRDHRFLAIYKNKRIWGIGEVQKVVHADHTDTGLQVREPETDVTDEERERIVGIIERAREERGWNLVTGKKFFLVDEFYETDYRKTSPGGMRGQQYFDLSDILKQDHFSGAEEIAGALSGETWE